MAWVYFLVVGISGFGMLVFTFMGIVYALYYGVRCFRKGEENEMIKKNKFLNGSLMISDYGVRFKSSPRGFEDCIEDFRSGADGSNDESLDNFDDAVSK